MSSRTPPAWRLLLSWKMLAMFSFGLVSGFPFYVVKDVLKAWMVDENLDLTTIGLFSAVSLPYTLKFIWSPLMDRFTPPFLGRRRGWILSAQIFLLLTISLLGQWNPHESLIWIAITAMAVSFFGATQDIALDAFRREYLKDNELGFGTGVWMNAWRLGMYVSVGVSFLSADAGIGWGNIHSLLAAMVLIGIVTTLLVREPQMERGQPQTLREAVIGPFLDFFKRRGALIVLAFILLYKLGDNMAGAMSIPFILQQGFTRTEYVAIVKFLGALGLLGGALLGGALMVKLRISQALLIFGILQALSTAGFAILVFIDHGSVFWTDYRQIVLSVIITFEFLATGLGQAAYAAFMAIQTNKRFTATQYALLTSLMAVPATIAGATTGFMAKHMGWAVFYMICALIAIPGLMLLKTVAPWNKTNEELDVMTRDSSL